MTESELRAEIERRLHNLRENMLRLNREDRLVVAKTISSLPENALTDLAVAGFLISIQAAGLSHEVSDQNAGHTFRIRADRN